jgi:hypothetical protein
MRRGAQRHARVCGETAWSPTSSRSPNASTIARAYSWVIAPADLHRYDAMRTLDRAVKDERLAARGAELVDSLTHTGPAPAQSWVQRWAAATGNPH